MEIPGRVGPLLLLVVIVIPNGSGVQIVHPDSGNIEAREGGEITFICEGTTNNAVTWYFNNVLLKSNGHFHIRSEDIHGEEATKQTTLFIPNVGLEDSGVYHCEEDGDPLGKQMIQLSVLQHARAVQIVTPREGRLEVREGKEITLKCVGDRTSRLEWLHNGRLLLESLRPRIMFTVSRDFQTNAKYSMMTRRSADAAAAGTYLCRNSRHKRDNDSVTVFVKPATESTVVIVEPNRERVTIPWRVAYQMRCKAPAITSVHWKLYHRRITAGTTDSRFSVREDLQGDWRYLTLTLLDPAADSQGSYVCVENGNEDNKAQVHVTVETRQVEVTVTTTTEDGHEVPSETRQVLLRVGSNEQLECSLSGGANQGIVADWSKDGIKLQEGPKFGIFRSGNMIGLNIRNTDQDDDGTYKCSFRHEGNEVVSECVFTVATVECPQLLTPANGSTMDCPSRPRYGDTCSFRCNQGFELHGKSTRTCELDTRGQPRWTGEQVTCLSPDTRDNGAVTLSPGRLVLHLVVALVMIWQQGY